MRALACIHAHMTNMLHPPEKSHLLLNKKEACAWLKKNACCGHNKIDVRVKISICK